MVVALTVTPALGRAAARARAPRRRRERVGRCALARGEATRPRSDARARGRWPRSRSLAARRLAVAAVSPPALASLADPSFKEPQPARPLEARPAPRGRRWPGSPARASRELRAVPGVSERRCARRPRGPVGPGRRRQLGRDLGDASTTPPTTTRRSPRCRTSSAGYPGHVDVRRRHLPGRVAASRTSPDASRSPTRPRRAGATGQDMDVLEAQGRRGRAATRTGSTASCDPAVELTAEEPTVQVEVDLVEAARYGIKPGDVRRAAADAHVGLEVGSLFEDAEGLRRGGPGNAGDPLAASPSVANLLIDTPSGGHVRLGRRRRA